MRTVTLSKPSPHCSESTSTDPDNASHSRMISPAIRPPSSRTGSSSRPAGKSNGSEQCRKAQRQDAAAARATSRSIASCHGTNVWPPTSSLSTISSSAPSLAGISSRNAYSLSDGAIDNLQKANPHAESRRRAALAAGIASASSRLQSHSALRCRSAGMRTPKFQRCWFFTADAR